MKKYLFILMSALVLVACGSDGADKEYKEKAKEAEKELEVAKEDTKRLEELSEEIDDTTESLENLQEEMDIESENEVVDDLDEQELKKELEYGALTEGDSITNLIIENDEIKVTIDIADSDIFDDKTILAETVYSAAGDVLLEYDGWDVLTIEFTDIGNVSLHRSEKESNEYGMDYFPLEKIIEQLN